MNVDVARTLSTDHRLEFLGQLMDFEVITGDFVGAALVGRTPRSAADPLVGSW